MQNWELGEKKTDPYFEIFWVGRSEKGKQTSFFLRPYIQKCHQMWTNMTFGWFMSSFRLDPSSFSSEYQVRQRAAQRRDW